MSLRRREFWVGGLFQATFSAGGGIQALSVSSNNVKVVLHRTVGLEPE